ncbi:hypothetical protein GGR58DRAFT_518189 [Xylaria digitata]|nr:hypothetical protein GGR58DRAFT_518189 [Xylaria digitata]
MAFGNQDVYSEAIVRVICTYLDDHPSCSGDIPESLSTDISKYLGREPGDTNYELTAAQTGWLHRLLYGAIWTFLRTDDENLSELLLHLGGWDSFLFCGPIAQALYNVQGKQIPYCRLVGTLIGSDPESLEHGHEHLVLRIMVWAFDDQVDSNLRGTLMAGAAACLSKVGRSVARHLGSYMWQMKGLRSKEFVTPADWQDWTKLMEAFGNDESQSAEIMAAAKEAAKVMHIE